MCFSSPKPPTPQAPSPPPAPTPLAPELPSDASGIDGVRKAATARRSLRIDLAPPTGATGLNIPM